MRLYRYLGPPEILDAVQDTDSNFRTACQNIACAEDVKAWCGTQNVTTAQITFTFVVDTALMLWIADRHSEHVACARGGRVRAAGEITFDVQEEVRVTAVTNQSTGYCPEPTSYPALAGALDAAMLPCPLNYTRSFDFRR